MNAQTDLLSKYASKGAVAITTLFMLCSRSQPDQHKVLENRQSILILSNNNHTVPWNAAARKSLRRKKLISSTLRRKNGLSGKVYVFAQIEKHEKLT